MGINGSSGLNPYQGTGGMVGVGVQTLRMANQAQTDMALKLLPMQVAENAGRAVTEAKGMFVDAYA